MMRITAYADRLLDDLDVLDWPEQVKTMQRNWIGNPAVWKCSSRNVDSIGTAGTLKVFTTRPDIPDGRDLRCRRCRTPAGQRRPAHPGAAHR